MMNVLVKHPLFPLYLAVPGWWFQNNDSFRHPFPVSIRPEIVLRMQNRAGISN
jgi:hypothetical protein